MTRQMVMVGFLQAQNCTNLPSSWRHPLSRDDSTSADYYQEIARILEAGKFHIAFFDDRLAMPDRLGNDHAHTVEYGIRCVKMDPIVVLTMMGAVTTKLGLASTASTTYFEPFDVARRFQTLDLMTNGRVGLERGHLGQRRRSAEHGPRRAHGARPALRPRRRVHGGGARPLGRMGRRRNPERQEVNARYADPTKVKRLDHKGKFFQVARAVHRAALGAGPSGHHSGRRQRPRPALCRTLGRSDLCRRPQHRHRQGRL